MDIFPQLIGEIEFRNFNETDYIAMSSVLDEVLASYVLDYLDNEKADPIIKETINTRLGARISELTFHLKLKESGIIDLVKSLSPESLSTSNVDLDTLIDKLEFLEKNSDKIRTSIPARTAKDYTKFAECMQNLLMRMRMVGIAPTYPDVADRIRANKFLFYVTGEKDHNTGVGILSNKRRQWTITLNGARYLKHCEKANISVVDRSKF